MADTTATPELVSTITCPVCGKQSTEEMPTDSCVWFYTCPHCQTRLKPREGDCCVFCSYGTVKCPPVQIDGTCSFEPGSGDR
jgi:hypothetical protein